MVGGDESSLETVSKNEQENFRCGPIGPLFAFLEEEGWSVWSWKDMAFLIILSPRGRPLLSSKNEKIAAD